MERQRTGAVLLRATVVSVLLLPCLCLAQGGCYEEGVDYAGFDVLQEGGRLSNASSAAQCQAMCQINRENGGDCQYFTYVEGQQDPAAGAGNPSASSYVFVPGDCRLKKSDKGRRVTWAADLPEGQQRDLRYVSGPRECTSELPGTSSSSGLINHSPLIVTDTYGGMATECTVRIHLHEETEGALCDDGDNTTVFSFCHEKQCVALCFEQYHDYIGPVIGPPGWWIADPPNAHKSAPLCFDLCRLTQGCSQFLWSDVRGGLCWLKMEYTVRSPMPHNVTTGPIPCPKPGEGPQFVFGKWNPINATTSPRDDSGEDEASVLGTNTTDLDTLLPPVPPGEGGFLEPRKDKQQEGAVSGDQGDDRSKLKRALFITLGVLIPCLVVVSLIWLLHSMKSGSGRPIRMREVRKRCLSSCWFIKMGEGLDHVCPCLCRKREQHQSNPPPSPANGLETGDTLQRANGSAQTFNVPPTVQYGSRGLGIHGAHAPAFANSARRVARQRGKRGLAGGYPPSKSYVPHRQRGVLKLKGIRGRSPLWPIPEDRLAGWVDEDDDKDDDDTTDVPSVRSEPTGLPTDQSSINGSVPSLGESSNSTDTIPEPSPEPSQPQPSATIPYPLTQTPTQTQQQAASVARLPPAQPAPIPGDQTPPRVRQTNKAILSAVNTCCGIDEHDGSNEGSEYEMRVGQDRRDLI
ncbi:unnamed protein product [Vitrella brassicaformis CCMP3155]|uniref:Uncharacterized protein n=1 Tax=Vitrella brassicaformis (strain CCMP3155) TaxID=1169540 RepID=A0A0G4ENT8_VITBC|nr:unnamed protein product [Vitrella brassicaformis CCMP3155]|eukprot:CEL99278.1 unnamed protein product [Vitrella brassicaformis CCMP3155]